jgi:predicted RNase H-like HicB family nuclease
MNHMEYAVVYHKTQAGNSASVPDLPGCLATGRTLTLTKRRMREAIAMHLKGMREDGTRIPRPTTQVEQVNVEDAA